jgi:riboflavin kinase
MADITFSGILVVGKGEAASFVAEPWAKNAFKELVYFDPWPGTLNLQLTEAKDIVAWETVQASVPMEMAAHDESQCAAKLYPAVVGLKQVGTIVLPTVADYPSDKVEIIAPVNLRDSLELKDGDLVEVTVFTSSVPPEG